MTILIRALTDDDVPTIVAACADWPELAQHGPPYWRPRSPAELRRKVAGTAGPAPSAEYSFVASVDTALIGECSLHSIDLRNRVAQVGVCIWSRTNRRKGYGRAAAQHVIDWGIGYLGLQRLEAWIVDGNQPSMKLFNSLGFTHEGTLRRRYLCAGEHRDMHLLALLA
jgi:[ribosomal protein S5]-alanine N-acetyltransferase